ncbi:MAG: SDR family oxidoreductase [Gammaproteobacteria bacterium]|jgi:NAD(P)-dependent dehydrogenase (short-subunit alcohol dehydrogenase family)|nr:SDR family oxidoreductase [Gammaproteobacteria bacterium]
MHSEGNSLQGKIAIVTGAASGIGEAIATLYLREGARVAVSDLAEHGLSDRFPHNPRVRAIEVDITADDAPQRIVDLAIDEFGGLDILVNNAGIALGKQFEETTDGEFDRIMNVNVRSVFRLTRAAVPHLRARGGGSVINLASIMSSTGGPQLSAYATSKHAVLGLSRGMAVDLGKYGIRVNALQPGSIWTGMSRPFFDDPHFRNYWETKAPLGRIGDPEDVAAVALFLATDAAKFVSGAGIAIDGAAGVNF